MGCSCSLENDLLRNTQNSFGSSRPVLDSSSCGLRPFPCVHSSYLRQNLEGPAPFLTQAEHEKSKRQHSVQLPEIPQKRNEHQHIFFEHAKPHVHNNVYETCHKRMTYNLCSCSEQEDNRTIFVIRFSLCSRKQGLCLLLPSNSN